MVVEYLLIDTCKLTRFKLSGGKTYESKRKEGIEKLITTVPRLYFIAAVIGIV